MAFALKTKSALQTGGVLRLESPAMPSFRMEALLMVLLMSRGAWAILGLEVVLPGDIICTSRSS
jgi:hypothetical protein